MTIYEELHPLHLYFFILFGITALLCVLFIAIKIKSKKGPKQLEQEKYNATMTNKKEEIMSTDSSVFNIWPYVSKLKSAKIISNKIKENELVYKVYRDTNDDFEHILLATEKENNFVSLVVNINKKKIMGYSLVDSNGNYSFT
jgi:hypothetical protein